MTGRAFLWEYLKSHAGNPLVGVGYESFWLGSRLEHIWERFGGPSYQAHNGYLETYLNLGYIGLALIICNIFSGLFKAWKELPSDFSIGILRISLIIAVVLYNYAEAAFSGEGNMLLLFWMAVIEPPVKIPPKVMRH
jgi:O-antigen ligase